MSTDWHVHCVDCNATHRFEDANHREDLMLQLCKHCTAIARLAPLIAKAGGEITIHTPWGPIDPAFFARHIAHTLMPINEYGRLLGQCHETVPCICGTSRPCKLDHGHAGDHDPNVQRQSPSFASTGDR